MALPLACLAFDGHITVLLFVEQANSESVLAWHRACWTESLARAFAIERSSQAKS